MICVWNTEHFGLYIVSYNAMHSTSQLFSLWGMAWIHRRSTSMMSSHLILKQRVEQVARFLFSLQLPVVCVMHIYSDYNLRMTGHSWVVQLQTDVTILIQILKLHQRHSYGILRLQSNSLSILPKPTQNMMQGTMPIWQYAPPHYLLFPQSVLNSSSSLIYSCVGHGISGFDSNLKFNIQAKQLKNQFLFLWVRAQTCRSHPASE